MAWRARSISSTTRAAAAGAAERVKKALPLVFVLFLTACATYRDFTPGATTVAELEAVMGHAAERRARENGETWLYYPRQPFGRKMFVARISPDEKLIAFEQRLSEEYVAKVIPNHTRREEVRDLFGPPYEFLTFPRLERETWTWYMRQFGNLPVTLNVQMSPDGVVREVYVLDDNNKGESRKR